jgi:hypothetical protein
MKFDLEKAKRGKPYKPAVGSFVELTFLAVTKNGNIVGQSEWGSVYTYRPEQLEMITVKKTYYANLYFNKHTNKTFIIGEFSSLEYANECAYRDDSNHFAYLKTIDYEVVE